MASVIINTVDSDIAIYAFYFNYRIAAEIFIKIGVKDRRRVINVREIASEMGQECCEALPALHAFTGNDYTSAFHGIGKGKAFKIVNSSDEFKLAFSSFGDSFTFESSLFPQIELFVCKLYGLRCDNTDEARYQKFVASKKSPEPQKLPPTRDALLCHCKRVSYVTAVIKRSLRPSEEVPPPDGYGWTLTNEQLSPVWMLRPPAPDEILQLISCNCKKTKQMHNQELYLC